MSKRCNEYDRIPRDFYATPAKAVAPLIPYLRAAGIKTFAEPCCGEGDLVGHLESYSLRCAYAGDIATGQDALALDDYGDSDSIVTNPPWSREVLHRLIPHFARIAPTWLLLDSDWAQTKQAVPFLPHCSDLLPIGRVGWFKESKHGNGKDNAAWYRFDVRHRAGPVLHPWRGRGKDQAPLLTVICQHCRKAYEPQRSTARFCSDVCRQRAHRQRLGVTVSVTDAPSPGAVIEQSESGEALFRYVVHDDVERFLADGWELLPALDHTHHAEYSALMRRRDE